MKAVSSLPEHYREIYRVDFRTDKKLMLWVNAAGLLIMILMGALLFVFSVFNFLLHLNLDRVRVPNIVVAVLSALIVLGGILLVR